VKRYLSIVIGLVAVIVLATPAGTQAAGKVRYDDVVRTPSGSEIAPQFSWVRWWPTSQLTYAFVNGTDDIVGDTEQEAVRAALQMWSDVTPLTFHEVAPASAQIGIRWAPREHGDGNPFDGQNGVLAHAFYPAVADEIHFDEDEIWTLSTRNAGAQPIDLVTVAAHEIGHALGLAHSGDSDALMAPYYYGSHRWLAGDDVAGIQSGYGTKPGPRFMTRNNHAEGVPSTVVGYGDPGDLPLAGNWDGDSDDTIGVYRPSTRTFMLNNANDTSSPEVITAYGDPGDVPLVGDWDGDGDDTIGLYRPSTRTFMLNYANDASSPEVITAYGDPGDVPLVGDWDGDGDDTIGLYRPSTRTFMLNYANDASPPEVSQTYGDLGDTPVIGDWDGNGQDEVGVYRSSERRWFLSGVSGFRFAVVGSQRVIPGDWDGNGTTTAGLYH
jgi:hypothetical protein